MPVIINQLDIQVEQPPTSGSAGTPPAAVPAPPAVDLAEMLRHLQERARRTEAT